MAAFPPLIDVPAEFAKRRLRVTIRRSGKGRNSPEAVGRRDRQQSASKEPVAGDPERRLGARRRHWRCGQSVFNHQNQIDHQHLLKDCVLALSRWTALDSGPGVKCKRYAETISALCSLFRHNHSSQNAQNHDSFVPELAARVPVSLGDAGPRVAARRETSFGGTAGQKPGRPRKPRDWRYDGPCQSLIMFIICDQI
jgi:hypothetical protein